VRRSPGVVAMALLSGCVAAPPDPPRLSTDDIRRQVTAIDQALENGQHTDWRGDTPGLLGGVTPGDGYTDRLGRQCRFVDLSVAAGQESYQRIERFCQTGDGAWMPDLPPGAGGSAIAVTVDTPKTSARDLRQRIASAKRRLNRRFDSHHDRRRELNRRFSAAERHRALQP